MLIRQATLADVLYIDDLRKKNREAVGFIPLQRYEMEIRGERHGDILICEENGDAVGFLYATHNNAGVTHIQQVAIQSDARRVERGKALVAAAIRERDWLISCRCAADLEAVSFWEAIGFAFDQKVNPKSVYGRGRDKATLLTRRKREILRFQKVVGGLFLPAPKGTE